jgi:tripeptide aminopeptidase
MVNAIRLAGEFLALLPAELSPERTEGREGFIHPTGMRGTAEEVTIDLILRDFEMAGLEAQHRLLRDAVARLVEREPRARIELDIQPQYRNMRYRLETDDRPVAIAKEAIRRAGLEPRVESVRGGTDGAHLTERGLPTPNLFAGMQEIHSPREWASLQDMAKAADVVVRLARLWEERA